MEDNKLSLFFSLLLLLPGEGIDLNPAGILHTTIPTEPPGIKIPSCLTESGSAFPGRALRRFHPQELPKPKCQAVTRGSCSKNEDTFSPIISFGKYDTLQTSFSNFIFY